MKARPSGVSSRPPSPRTASEIRKPSPAGRGQRGGVELHVLGVDDARAGPVGHGQPVAARAFGIGGVAVDAAQAAGGQDGGPGQVAVDGAPGLLEDVGAVAGDRLVDRQRVAGVVREGDQVHRRGRGDDADVGQPRRRGQQRLDDGLAGGVAHVQDARARVAASRP